MKIAIIGLGNFGIFVSKLISQDHELFVMDNEQPRNDDFKYIELKELTNMDIIVLCIPLSAYDIFLNQLSKVLNPNTLLIDVCSVKVLPQKYITKIFPTHKNLLLTHPLFGSISASNGTAGHTLIITKKVGTKAGKVVDYFRKSLKLNLVTTTALKHDKEMAQIHALTFFVAKGLGKMDLRQANYFTPSYNMLIDLINFDKGHSEDLYETIQMGNPYSNSIRKKYINSLKNLDKVIITSNDYDKI